MDCPLDNEAKSPDQMIRKAFEHLDMIEPAKFGRKSQFVFPCNLRVFARLSRLDSVPKSLTIADPIRGIGRSP